MLFTYVLHFINSNTFVRSLDLQGGKQCLHYLTIITLLDTGTLMIHHQSNEYNYFVFQLSLRVHHCLSKFGRPTKKVHVRLYIFIKLSRGKKKSKFESKYVAKSNLMQWNCFEHSNEYL